MYKRLLAHPLLVPVFLFWAYVYTLGLLQLKHTSYDEEIVKNISKQQNHTLLELISSEPHPPGFYFLVKLTDHHNLDYRLVLTSLCYLIWLTSWLILKKLDNYPNYHYGLLLIISSYLFASTTYFSKQDILSIPLLFLLFSHHQQTHKNNPKSYGKIVTTIILQTLILSLSYINFLYALIVLNTKLNIRQFRLSDHIPSVTMAFLFSIYLIAYGGTQLINNQGRFGWVIPYNQGPVHSIQQALVGFSNRSLPYDFILTGAVLLPAITWFKSAKKLKKRHIYYGVIIISFVVTAQLLGLYSRERYLAGPIMLVFIFLGKIVSRTKYGLLYFILILTIFTTSRMNLKLIIDQQIIHKNTINSSLLATDSDTIITNLPDYSWYVAVMSDKGVVPVNPLNTSAYSSNLSVSWQQLQLQKLSTNDFSINDISDNIYKLGKANINYLHSTNIATSTYDPENKIYSALQLSCKNSQVIKLNTEFLHILFTDCM